MERKSGLNALWVLLLFLAVAFCAEATERKEAIYKAYINGKMDVWKQVMTELESESVRSPSEQLELLEYYYGYVGFLLGQDRTAQAKPYVKKGIDQIALLEKKRIQPATVLAYKGAFAGYSIALNKIKAVSLGPKSLAYLSEAIQKDPKNVQAMADYANALFFAPAMFGGDRDMAVKLYLSAVKQLERNQKTTSNWFYLHSMTAVAHAYVEMGQLQQAKQMYQKILKFEPDFSWVRDELYPKLIEK